jgi:hypothetical protein
MGINRFELGSKCWSDRREDMLLVSSTCSITRERIRIGVRLGERGGKDGKEEGGQEEEMENTYESPTLVPFLW